MSDFLERELRDALRSKDPGEDFTHNVMARIQAQQKAEGTPQAFSPRVLQWIPAALAASLLMIIVIKHEPVQEPTAQEDGLHAREQLLQALRVTSEKLDLAYQVVHDESRDEVRSDSGA